MPSVKVFRGQKQIVSAICRYPFKVHPKFFCIPKSIYNMGNFTCHMLHFINGMHNLMCDMRYLINVPCSVFYAYILTHLIHVYPFRYVECLNPCTMCLKDSIYYVFYPKNRTKSILRIELSAHVFNPKNSLTKHSSILKVK